MFEVDKKKCDRTAAGKEEDQLRFGVLIHSCIVILSPIAAMVNGGNIKKCYGEEGEGTTSLVFLKQITTNEFWGTEGKKKMRRALTIHDKMTLVFCRSLDLSWKV